VIPTVPTQRAPLQRPRGGMQGQVEMYGRPGMQRRRGMAPLSWEDQRRQRVEARWRAKEEGVQPEPAPAPTPPVPLPAVPVPTAPKPAEGLTPRAPVPLPGIPAPVFPQNTVLGGANADAEAILRGLGIFGTSGQFYPSAY